MEIHWSFWLLAGLSYVTAPMGRTDQAGQVSMRRHLCQYFEWTLHANRPFDRIFRDVSRRGEVLSLMRDVRLAYPFALDTWHGAICGEHLLSCCQL